MGIGIDSQNWERNFHEAFLAPDNRRLGLELTDR